MNRRIQKTKTAIIEAFISLISEKNFEQITINEIADRANVNYSTMYLHYADKYDSLDQCMKDYLGKLFQSCMPNVETNHLTIKASLLRRFEYLKQNALFYSTMLTNKGILTFRNHILSTIAQYLQEE